MRRFRYPFLQIFSVLTLAFIIFSEMTFAKPSSEWTTLAENYLKAFQKADLAALKLAVTPEFLQRMGGEDAVISKLRSVQKLYPGSRVTRVETRAVPKEPDSRYFKFSIRLKDGTQEPMPWLSCRKIQGKWKIDLTLSDFDPDSNQK